MEEFSALSGMQVNKTKSRVFGALGWNQVNRNRIYDILGLSFTSNLERYLGIPLHVGRVKKEDFSYILEKLKVRLSGWKANLLNMTGRATLVQTTLTTIPLYTMQSTWLPRFV